MPCFSTPAPQPGVSSTTNRLNRVHQSAAISQSMPLARSCVKCTKEPRDPARDPCAHCACDGPVECGQSHPPGKCGVTDDGGDGTLRDQKKTGKKNVGKKEPICAVCFNAKKRKATAAKTAAKPFAVCSRGSRSASRRLERRSNAINIYCNIYRDSPMLLKIASAIVRTRGGTTAFPSSWYARSGSGWNVSGNPITRAASLGV